MLGSGLGLGLGLRLRLGLGLGLELGLGYTTDLLRLREVARAAASAFGPASLVPMLFHSSDSVTIGGPLWCSSSAAIAAAPEAWIWQPRRSRLVRLECCARRAHSSRVPSSPMHASDWERCVASGGKDGSTMGMDPARVN